MRGWAVASLYARSPEWGPGLSRMHLFPTPPRLAVVGVLLLGLLLASCSSDGSESFGPSTTGTTLTPPVVEAGMVTLPPGFVPADTRGVILPAFQDKEQPTDGEAPPKETVPVTDPIEGKATLSGIVTAEGKRAGGRVRIERLVGDKVGVLDLDVGGDGAFKVEHALGGRYRIRAWSAPDFSAVPSVTVFLPAKGDLDIEVPMQKFEGFRLQAALDTGLPHVGETVKVKALLTTQSVDGSGYVVGEGAKDGVITLTAAPGYRVTSANPTKTGADGWATWTVVCQSAGIHDVTVEYLEQSTIVSLPACVVGEFATTTSSTSSTSTTSTLPVPSFPVGSTFKPPAEGPFPQGQYEPDLGTDCQVTFEEYTNGKWSEAGPVSGDVVLLAPARKFRPLQGTSACIYTRTI